MNRILLITLFLLAVFCTTSAQNYEIYVSDAGNFSSPPWKILIFDSNGQNPVVFINTNLAWPQDIHFIEDSNLVLISNLSSNSITRHNATTGAYISDFATGISGPTRMKIGPDGLLYVLQWSGTGLVKRYELDGTFVNDFTSVGVPQSIGIDWDSAGNMYVSSYNGGSVRRFDPNGNDLGFFINFNLAGPTNIWFDTNGDLLVVDYNGSAVKRFNSSGLYLNDFLTGLGNPEGVDFLPNGDFVIGNGSTGSVKQFDQNGNFVQDLIQPGAGGLLTPNAVKIRDLAPVGIPEHGHGSTQIVDQNIGSAFSASNSITDLIEELHIYSITGQLVKSFDHEVDFYGFGNELEKGVYFLRARLKDYSEITQKIIVTQ